MGLTGLLADGSTLEEGKHFLPLLSMDFAGHYTETDNLPFEEVLGRTVLAVAEGCWEGRQLAHEVPSCQVEGPFLL